MLMVQDVDLTPNPHALKFILNERLLQRETRSFESKEEAQNDPLAKGIFEIEGVESVFYMDKFITIVKNPGVGWEKIQMPFLTFIRKFDKSLIPPEEITGSEIAGDSEKLKKINFILDKRVRPALAGDGGGLEILGLEGNKLLIRYQGACDNCPSAIHGTLVAIENLLVRELGEKIDVVLG